MQEKSGAWPNGQTPLCLQSEAVVVDTTAYFMPLIKKQSNSIDDAPDYYKFKLKKWIRTKGNAKEISEQTDL